MRRHWLALLLAGFGLGAAPAFAAPTLYVTDSIQLGLHQEPADTSPMLATLASGTPVEVLERRDGFVRVRSAGAPAGWMKAEFLVAQQTAGAQLASLAEKHAKIEQDLRAAQAELAARERALQKAQEDLKAAQATSAPPAAKPAAAEAVLDPAMEEALAQAQRELAEARRQLAALQTRTDTGTGADPEAALAELREENLALRTRIEVAMGNLKGEGVLNPADLQSIRPNFPAWYTGLLVSALILGFVGGFGWFDYRLRRRHGGFRL